MKKYNKNYFYLLMIIISLIVIVFTYNNSFLYKNPIVRVTNIVKSKIREGENKEIYYKETATGIIENGKYKNNIITFDNYSTTSGVYDDSLYKGCELLVELNEDGSKVLSIINIKRDKYIVLLIVLFIDMLIIVGKKQGLKTMISLIINVFISLGAISLYKILNINILLLFIPISIFFIVFSLFCTNGFNKKTNIAIISAIISTFISFLLAYVLIHIYEDKIPFWFMDYAEAFRDYKNLFYVNILLCGLGAIMDISITMSSSLNELVVKNPLISRKELIKSGKEIAKDIVGSMVNVMFFTIYSGVIPLGILVIRNNMPLSVVITNYGEIEMIRILTGCISIVLSIPISLYIAMFFLKKENKHD